MNLYAVAAIISGLIFVLGFSLGWNVSNLAAEELRLDVVETEIYLKNLELEDKLIQDMDQESYCSYAESRLPEVRGYVYEIGNTLQGREPSEETFRLAKRHVAAIVNYWLYSQEVKERCNLTHKDVLFFYTIDDGSSKTQGFVLDKLVRENPELTVLAINRNLDSPLVSLLTKKYNITRTSALVIDGQAYQGMWDYGKLKTIIG